MTGTNYQTNKINKDMITENKYIWIETDNLEATEIMTYKEIINTIEWYNNNLSTNYKSIDEFNKGEEYIKILIR